MQNSLTLAITGASGVQYGLRLLQILAQQPVNLHCLISDAAKCVIRAEVADDFPHANDAITNFLQTRFDIDMSRIMLPGEKDWMSVVASGSSAPRCMVICPCSMGTLAAIAHGMSDNLIERAADVILKERGKLILVARETPLSQIHLQNMLTLTQAGAVVMPATPGFYHQPKTLDDLVDGLVQRILDQLPFDIRIAPRWGDSPARL